MHCKHTLFFEFWGLLNEGIFWKKFGLRRLRLGLGVSGDYKGALASALIHYQFQFMHK